MDTTLLIMRPGRKTETRVADLPLEPGYDCLRGLIRPLLHDHDFEHVTVLYGGRRADMFVDEMGGCKALPMNEAATAIYRAPTLRRHPDINPDSLSAIYGTAILFPSRIVWS